MSRPVFMIAIEPPGNAAPGMMTGRLEIDHAGRLVPDLVPRSPEFDWPAAAFKAPTVQIASRVMIMLAEYGRANQNLRLVEFHPAEEAPMSEIKNVTIAENRLDDFIRLMAKLEQVVSEMRPVLIAIRADALSPAPVEAPEPKGEP